MRNSRAILLGGVAAGALDLLWAFAISASRARPVVRVPQAIASGLLGKAAFEGGASTVALGVALHFLIAIGICAVYVGVSGWFPRLAQRPWLAGPLFGIAVYLLMSFVVVPLSAAPWRFKFTPGEVALALVAHTLCVGVPIALASRRYSGAGHRRSVAP